MGFPHLVFLGVGVLVGDSCENGQLGVDNDGVSVDLEVLGVVLLALSLIRSLAGPVADLEVTSDVEDDVLVRDLGDDGRNVL
jgi:hypothetical protein